MKLRKRLTEEKLDPSEIEKRIEKAQKILNDKLAKGELEVESKDSHLQSELKEKGLLKLRDAFKVDRGYKAGSAFDFETQEKKRLEKMATKHEKYVCLHPSCGKSYQIEKEYLRHLKYKHDNQKEPLNTLKIQQ